MEVCQAHVSALSSFHFAVFREISSVSRQGSESHVPSLLLDETEGPKEGLLFPGDHGWVRTRADDSALI